MRLELPHDAKLLLRRRATTRRSGHGRCDRRSTLRRGPLSEKILWKEFHAGETIVVGALDEEIVFRAIEGFEPPPVELAGSAENS